MRQNILIALFGSLLLSACLARKAGSRLLQAPVEGQSQDPHAYHVEVLDERNSAHWVSAGNWNFGGRQDTKIIRLAAFSRDEGKTIRGRVHYQKNLLTGSTVFQGERISENTYEVEVFEGKNEDRLWVKDGIWRIGGRTGQPVTKLNLEGDGSSFTGTVVYLGQEPIKLRATQA